MDNSRMMQRNGRITNLSSCNCVPHYNRAPIKQSVTQSECGCGNSCPCSKCNGLAISSIEMQKWRNIYELDKGFTSGTIFMDIDLPFCGTRGVGL